MTPQSSFLANGVVFGGKVNWNLATAQSQTVQEAFEILAGKPVTDSQLKTVLESVYPIVGQTEFTDEFVAYVNRIQAHRQSVLELFQGAAVGQTSAFVGTAWGAWNSVVEYEDYAKSRRQASSILVGAGAVRKDLAFRQLIAL